MILWRREGDSNPRYSSPYTRFPGVLLKPLGHLSICLMTLSPNYFTTEFLFHQAILFICCYPSIPEISSDIHSARSSSLEISSSLTQRTGSPCLHMGCLLLYIPLQLAVYLCPPSIFHHGPCSACTWIRLPQALPSSMNPCFSCSFCKSYIPMPPEELQSRIPV